MLINTIKCCNLAIRKYKKVLAPVAEATESSLTKRWRRAWRSTKHWTINRTRLRINTRTIIQTITRIFSKMCSKVTIIKLSLNVKDPITENKFTVRNETIRRCLAQLKTKLPNQKMVIPVEFFRKPITT